MVFKFQFVILLFKIIIPHTNKIVYQKIHLPPKSNCTKTLTGATCHSDKRITTHYKILQQKRKIYTRK